jgi:hypothetical protein
MLASSSYTFAQPPLSSLTISYTPLPTLHQASFLDRLPAAPIQHCQIETIYAYKL